MENLPEIRQPVMLQAGNVSSSKKNRVVLALFAFSASISTQFIEPMFWIQIGAHSLTVILGVLAIRTWLEGKNKYIVYGAVFFFLCLALALVVKPLKKQWDKEHPKIIRDQATVPPAPTQEDQKPRESVRAKPKANPKMPSLLSLFMTDFKNKGYGLTLLFQAYSDFTFSDNSQLRVFINTIEDHENRSKFCCFYIQSSRYTFDAIKYIATECKKFLDLPVGVESGGENTLTRTRSDELVFTGRVFIYHEDTLTLPQLGKLAEAFEQRGLAPEFRSTPHALSVWSAIRAGRTKEPLEFELRDNLIKEKNEYPSADTSLLKKPVRKRGLTAS